MCPAHAGALFLRSGKLITLSTTCVYVKKLGIFLRNSTCFSLLPCVNSIHFLPKPISDHCEIGYESFKGYLDLLNASKGLKNGIDSS